jgi:AraC family transcriptional regulator, transcriptional activator FtrA
MRKTSKRSFNPRVAAITYPGLCVFEYGCAAEVFGLHRPELGDGWYQFETCASERQSVIAQYGMRIHADYTLDQLSGVGTVIIPGWKGVEVPVPDRLIDALLLAHASGARLLSICSGAFVLAATGLLDGKRATTHWRYAEALAKKFPRIEVDPAVLYVDAGQVLSSAGSAAGLDLCLHLVRRDFGARVANHVARRLVMPAHREGGQAQFVEMPVTTERNSLTALMQRVQKDLRHNWTIAELAQLANMSERTLMRRFKANNGITCLDWLVRARLQRAKLLLEKPMLNIEQVAAESGFGSAITLRHHFRRQLGLSPGDYRKSFAASR